MNIHMYFIRLDHHKTIAGALQPVEDWGGLLEKHF